MSYEPTLILNAADLERERDKIEFNAWTLRTDELRAYQTLQKALDNKPAVLHGGKNRKTLFGVILIQPELTQHNANVRRLLEDLNIEYAIWD